MELLNIEGMMVPHKVVPIVGDGACLFRAISYVIYGNQNLAQDVRNEIVGHVIEHWGDFAVLSYDAANGGNNHSSAAAYYDDMSKPHTFGGTCELQAAAEIYPIVLEVFNNGQLLGKFGTDGNPVERLRFTGNLSSGHFDAYNKVSDQVSPYLTQTQSESSQSILKNYLSPTETALSVTTPTHENSIDSSRSVDSESSYTPKKRRRRARFTNRTSQKNKQTSKSKYRNTQKYKNTLSSYVQKNVENHRKASAKYQKENPTIHLAANKKYQKANPKIHNKAVATYNQSLAIKWQVKMSGFKYDPKTDYENDVNIFIGSMSQKCRHCKALKYKDESDGLCCSAGKVVLPQIVAPPEPLYSLLLDLHPESKHFLELIRMYNGCFQMTSFGAKQINETGFMPTFKVQGQVYHLVGSLLPNPQKEPQFLQIYFVGEDEKETQLRCKNYSGVKPGIVNQLQSMLHDSNPFIKDLKTAIQSVPADCPNFQVVINADKKPDDAHAGRYNVPSASEVALVIVGQEFQKRDIILHSHDNSLKRISELHRSYDAFQYPLMFTRGEDGYSVNIPLYDAKTNQPLKKTVSASDFYAYRIMLREGEINYLLYYRALLNQFLVDMYAKIETERLNYIKYNQSQLRSESYIHLRDAIGQQDADQLGKVVVLPSSFTGSPRYMHEKTQDAMTYVRNYGSPDLFITFTCNPKWSEIEHAIIKGQKSHDRHDQIARIFHMKVKKLMKLLTKGQIFGPVRCHIFTVEWQKRGLPHIHILLWMCDRVPPNQIDSIICAEIPDPESDPLLYSIIKSNMIHGPCGMLNQKSPCMKDGRCTKKFPRPHLNETITGNDGYPQYRRRAPDDGGFTVTINDITVDNRWVVPYNPVLSRAFNAHINIEYCHSVKSIKYICKYVNKGSDQAAFTVERDEIHMYECGRYISSAEAVWRILCFPVHERFPAIIHLAVHLENGQRVYFDPSNSLVDKVNHPTNTTLMAFFDLCKADSFAKTLLYVQVPSYYVLQNHKFIRRKRGADVDGWPGIKIDAALGRVYTVHPNNVECYHLRLLLHTIRGPTSFTYLKTVDGVVHPTYQGACKALGLLENDDHWVKTLEEAALCHFPNRLRELFAVMIVFCQISDPSFLWHKFKESFSEDLIRKSVLSSEDIYNKCLLLIEDSIMNLGGLSISEYGLPKPDRAECHVVKNIHLERETNYDVSSLQIFVTNNVQSLTDEQNIIYEKIIDSITYEKNEIYFLDAPGGTGKTFLLNLLLAKVRSSSHIAIAVASSGIAATLLSGGKTAHATFKLPLNLNIVDKPVCNITKQSDIGKILRVCKLIVWDECTMAHKKGFEALDNTLQDIRDNDDIMGGVTVLLAGDFRQTLPVISRGTKADEIRSCLKSSYLWPRIEKLSLKKNMRVHLHGDSTAGAFSELLLKIGDGKYPVSQGQICLSSDLGRISSSLDELIETVYPNITNIKNKPIEWLCQRAILCPKNKMVSEINDSLLKSFHGETIEYLAVDRTVEQDDAVHYPIEFLNTLNPPGVPPYRLTLKVGAPVMLLRNIKPPKLCNGTRLQIKVLHKNVVEGTIMTGSAQGETVFIPRIPMIPSDYPFHFKRLQFPLRLCFAMTINKAQGQSLKVAGVDLREDCFSHGQLYVACSRVSSATSLVILAPTAKTANIVYREVL